MRSLKRTLLAGVASLFIATAPIAGVATLGVVGATSSARAQIPTIDVAAIAQLLEQLTTLQEQLSQLQGLYSQAQQAYAAITGGRGMELIAPGLDLLRDALPADFGNNMVLMSGIEAFGNIANGAAQVIRTANQITSMPGNDFYFREVVRRGDRVSGELAAAQQIYNVATQRRSNLDQLRQRLATVADPAAAPQLQARIAYETSQGINDLIQINSLGMLQTSNQSIDRQRSMEAERASRDATINGLLGN